MKPESSRAALAAEITEARRSLIATLASLRPEDWEAPSLCAGWRVRDVVGHLLHQFSLLRAPYPRAGLVRAGFRVNRFLAAEARRHASDRGPSDLLAALERAEYERTRVWKLYPWPAFSLAEFVIHTQDIRRSLGIVDKPTARQLVAVAGVMARPVRFDPFRRRLPATRFEATDLVWSYGEGPEVRGPLEAIVMVLAGRGQALRELSGEGVARLQEALP